MAKQKKAQEVSAVRQAKHGWIITFLFTVLSVLWISPILMVLLNSFKRKAYIFKHPFGISTLSILCPPSISILSRQYTNGPRFTTI